MSPGSWGDIFTGPLTGDRIIGPRHGFVQVALILPLRGKVGSSNSSFIGLRGGEVAYRDLRDFLRTLEKEGELKRITAEVDPVLEITEIADRSVKAGGPALLFERPKGSSVPLVTNLVGSERRMNLSLEVQAFEDVAARISSFLDMQSPQGFLEKVKMLPKLAEIGSFFPKTVRN